MCIFIFQGNFFGALATNQGSNSIDLNSASGVEAQQETFLRLTDEGNAPFLPPTANTLTNDIFPATLVGSSIGFGDTNDRLPPGTAGFGTVESVGLGSVNIQVQNQNLDVLPTYGANNVQAPAFNNNGPTNFVSLPNNDNLPTYGNNQQNYGTNNINQPDYGNNNINQQNYGTNNINQPNYGTNNINQPNYGNNANLPTYGNNNNPFIQSTPNPNAFGQSTPAPVNYGQSTLTPNVFGQSTLTPNFGPSTPNSNTYQQQPSTAIPNELPNYGQDSFFGSPFKASSPIQESQQNNQQTWKGANQQQQLLFQNQNVLSQLNSQTRFVKNERPVRFPGDANNRFDVSYEDLDSTYYDQPYEHYERESSQDYQQYYSNPSTPSPNIIAELAKYSKKNNLIYKPGANRQDPYIQYPKESAGEADKELILYPSGQLILNQNNQYPTTIGPNLRQYLSSLSFKHQQKPPPYVFARRKVPSYERETELFDPLLEGDEIIERSDTGSDDYSSAQEKKDDGLLPILIRTAKDDLKLVGDVIKMAFARRRKRRR